MQCPESDAGEVRRLARDLLPRAHTIAAQVTERVLRVVPELAPAGTPDAVALVQESTDQNIGGMFSTLAFGITPTTIELPAGTQDLLGNLTAAGGNVTDLLRAYRAGHQVVWRLWSDHVYAEIHQPELLPAVLRISSAHLFDFIDQVCQRILDIAPASISDAGPRRLSDRDTVIRQLLGSAPVDLSAATACLSYDLSRYHVALLVAPLTETVDVRRELERLLAAVQVPALVIPSGEGNWWSWLGFATAPSSSQLARVAAVEVSGVLVGMGEPGRGREGFRRSLTQAREAERVGRLAQHPKPGVVAHREVEIVGMLCGDPDRARALSAAQLGELTRRDETGERLRTTVRALLANGHNRGRAAAALHVHHKTVAYRLAQAEQLLGKALSEDTFALEAALMIDQALYGP